jgi:hypothetical protein
MFKGFLVFIGVAGFVSVASAGEVYRWVDSNGKVQYGDEPAPGSETVTIQAAPPADTSYIERLNKQKKLSEATTLEKEQLSKDKTQQLTKTKEMETKCQEVKEQLRVLDLKRPVYVTGEKGGRAYLSDADRTAKVEEYRELAQKYCK